MSTVHLILQGKGGVGKSFIATLLAQYLAEKGVPVRCFDADPVNSTLSSFPALNTTKLDLIESSDKGRRINPRRFDDLVEQIAGQPAESHVIVDTGSSAFVPLLHYVATNEVPAILSQNGHELVVHTVVTGGQALVDTLHGAAQLVKQLDDARFVVWLNPFWGPIADDGKIFEQRLNSNKGTKYNGLKTTLLLRERAADHILHAAVSKSDDALLCQVVHEFSEDINRLATHRRRLAGTHLQLPPHHGICVPVLAEVED